MTPSPVVSRTPRANATPVRLRGALPAGRRRDRGAVLVHVAVAMSGLLAFSALSIDLGTLWVARAQAQNAADAAALAGTVSLAYVNPADADGARAAALAVAQAHSIWGAPLSSAAVQTEAGPCPTGSPSVPGDCLRVAVATPLPVFFSSLFGVGSTNVAASASAKVMVANAAPCVRPLALVDRWLERYPVSSTWTDDDVYNGYDATGAPVLPPGVGDAYSPPQADGPGTGFTVVDMAGVEIVRTVFDTASPAPIAAGSIVALDLPRPGAEGEPDAYRYRDNLSSCSTVPLGIGATAPAFFPHRGFYTTLPLQALVAQDAGAIWDPGTRAVVNSAFNISPRIITIPVIDPDAFSRQPRTGGGPVTAVVRNLVGFFVADVFEGPGSIPQIRGVIVPTAGRFDAAAPVVNDAAGFLRTVALVR